MALRIAIFGDSFCSLNIENSAAWPHTLGNISNAQIEIFGKPATGILWSYRQMLLHADNFDWLIWCVSSIQRLTINLPEPPWTINYSGPGCDKNYPSVSINDILKTADDFFVKVDFYQDLSTLYRALVLTAMHKWPNLTVVPCFLEPMDCACNLSKISNLELDSMKKLPTGDIWSKFRDLRPCHLTEQNNGILAEQIWQNRDKQVVSLDESAFIIDHDLIFDNYFHKL